MKITKAILTGGGRATRLRPITNTINKHLIPLAGKPMIWHAIEKAVEAGVEEIFINTNPGETQLQKHLGDGGHWGIKIQYFEQEGGPQGIAHVVKCAEKFVGEDPFMFYLSDNIILGSLKPFFKKFEEEKLDCLIALSKVPDPERFGVPRFNKSGQLVEVLEKPAAPPSDFAVTGIYLFNPVFFKAFATIHKSARGEYEIPSIFNYLLNNGYKVGYQEITGWWKDTGKADDLIAANKLLMDELPADHFRLEGNIANGADLKGKVAIGPGSTVSANVKINGPVIIGPNCQLNNCVIGPYVTIGSGTTITGAQIKNSIIFSNNTISVNRLISGSIIGQEAVIKESREENSHLILGDNTMIEI